MPIHFVAYFSKWMSRFVCLRSVYVHWNMCQPHIFLSVPIMHFSEPFSLFFTSFPAPPVSLTISGRTLLDWQRCYRTLTLLVCCTCCIVSCCTAPSLAAWRRSRSPTILLWSRWHFRACDSSTALPCLTSLPSRYSTSSVLQDSALNLQLPGITMQGRMRGNMDTVTIISDWWIKINKF